MEIYLGGQISDYEIELFKKNKMLYLLQTFYDMRKMKYDKIQQLLNLPLKNFMLDSGAFTFMNSGVKVNWKSYVDEYVNFINKYDIQNFIELDLYGIIGIERTEMIRRYIEHKTNKKPIPVYHGTMPISYYRMLCNNYSYVALSATGTIQSSKYVKNKKILKQLIKIGHRYKTKLHGLGYTRLENLNNTDVCFDSVDSSSWTYGKRFGIGYKIKHGKICQINMKQNKTGIKLNENNFADINIYSWCKMQHLKDKENNHE